jgi:Spy/CpxP family protein refolding chaperone
MFSMKLIRNTLIAASLLAGLSTLSFAQMGPTAGGEHMAKMHEHMSQRHAQHLTDLKTQLKLQNEQEAAWATFTQAVQIPAQAPARPDRAAFDKMSTPERLDEMQAHRAKMDVQMQKHAEATKLFYGVLNTEQKKVFDSESLRFMHGMRKASHRQH